MKLYEGGPHAAGASAPWFDKVPSKFEGWDASCFIEGGFRAVPGLLGALFCPCGERCGAYAEFCEFGRLCGGWHHG